MGPAFAFAQAAPCATLAVPGVVRISWLGDLGILTHAE